MRAAEGVRVYLGLGSNLGDRCSALRNALRRIDELPGTSIESVSPVYETEPWSFRDQPDFLNCAAAVLTRLPADELFEALKGIERSLGRLPAERYHPRHIDIDIILYGDLVIGGGHLTVPHPELARRRFVLQPLCDLAPSLVHPVEKKTIRELLTACEDHGALRAVSCRPYP
ncbi:MAG: 2-amino-4-hydroxy-6-hydroxymethyldihydropteridine diphosphokinase [Bacteroidota bacterium]|nr:2-amino-4-hydroxy-6-hydroxymethyldihydropteridine diphosphokinase [Bacteroidota bacterium]